jgi:hypothetical protein
MENTLIFRDTRSEVETSSPLEKYYLFDSEATITNFFKEHPHLIDVLSKSIEIIVSYFSNDQICLMTKQESEYNSSSELSQIIIKTHLNPSTALQNLSHIDEDFSQINILRNILVHVEFQ